MATRPPTPDELRAFFNRLGPMMRFLGRSADRLEARGFIVGDPLLDSIRASQDQLHRLSVLVHGRVTGTHRAHPNTQI